MPKRINNIELRSDEVQDVLTKPPHWMLRWGNGLLVVILSSFIISSFFIKYPEVTSGRVIITSDNPPEKKYAQIGKKIEEFYVVEKQFVKAGSKLALLESIGDFKDIQKLKYITDSISLHMSSKDFFFPIDDLPRLHLGEVESDFNEFQNDYLNFVISKSLPISTEELAFTTLQLKESEKRLKEILYQQNISIKEISLKEKKLKRSEKLFKKGVISEQDFELQKISFLESQRDFKNLKLNISNVEESIEETKKRIKTIKLQKSSDYLTLRNRAIRSFNQLIVALEEWYSVFVIKAQTDGFVYFANYWGENQVVQKGDLLFTIIPKEHNTPIAKLKVSPLNAGKLNKGKKVMIELDNFPSSQYGYLEGEIRNVSVIPTTQGNYNIDVVFPGNLITTYGKEIEFQHEMSGTGEVILEDLNVFQRIFFKIREILD